jgi:hypothetical protein
MPRKSELETFIEELIEESKHTISKQTGNIIAAQQIIENETEHLKSLETRLSQLKKRKTVDKNSGQNNL